jgi:chaperonin GroEL
MVSGGYEAIESNQPLNDVLDGMERAVEKAVSYINKQRRPLDRDDVTNLAKTAGGSAAAKLVTEAFERAKPEGVWMVEDDVAPASSSVEIQEGIRFSRGYLSEEFANDPETGNCVLEDCFVLVYEGKIQSSHELAPVIGLIAEARRPTLILAEDIEGTALELLIINNKKRLSCVAVKAPGHSEDKKSWLKDIAALTGGASLGGVYGKNLDQADLSDLGTAERVVVEKWFPSVGHWRGYGISYNSDQETHP